MNTNAILAIKRPPPPGLPLPGEVINGLALLEFEFGYFVLQEVTPC